MGDWKPYIYKTENYGKSWALVTHGIPDDFPVRVVREDPNKEGLLYAGTEYGLFISFDDGMNWQAFQQNLPVTPITDMKIHRNDLVLSTMGRGFQILDNVSTLHQDYEKLDLNKPKLFKPENTIRYRYSSFNDNRTVVPSPPYPRPSVVIDYYLPDSLSAVQLQFLNAAGKVIRSYTSKKPSKSEDPDSISWDMATNETIEVYHAKLNSHKGYHRFNWDMRHAGAWNKKNPYSRGIYAAPGNYSVKLIINGKTQQENFELLPDPRVIKSGVTIEDLKAQEELALKVTDLLSQARIKAEEIDKKLEQLKSKDSEEKHKLTELRDKLVRKKGRYTEVKFINQIEYLLGILNRGDQRPGKDVYDRYGELERTTKELH